MRPTGNTAVATDRYGFTLLEVLIALVVLSVGLLGLAALQGVGLRSTHGANLIWQASLLAYDMADRIRANPAESAYDAYQTQCPDPVPDSPLVAADLAEWACAVEALLPRGRGRITGARTGAVTRYTITIEWQDAQIGDAGEPWDFELTVEI
jgi:type IV pilus assembly protein PilV